MFCFVLQQHTNELPLILLKEHPKRFRNFAEAAAQTAKIKNSIGQITRYDPLSLELSFLIKKFVYCREIFEAYENEYTIFSPMTNCFEVFGLDFMVTDNFETSLLEINPGPDFKQTGDNLRKLIVNLWDGISRVILDEDTLERDSTIRAPDSTISSMRFSKVYDKELSVSKVKQEMKFA